jgi:uncharacterized repeat protein (TIGR01451 family)
VEISDLTIRNGNAATASAFGYGGGIYASAQLTVRRSVISGNHAARSGGGISTFRDLVVVDSTIDANIASQNGGGISTGNGVLTMTGSTVSNNQAGSDGGGIYTLDADMLLTNVTVSNNQATSNGGGIKLDSGEEDPDTEISSSTIANNQAVRVGGVSGPEDGDVTIRNTIIANNTGGDCDPRQFNSAGHNLSSDTSCGFSTFGTGDQQGIDPLLAPLADNGGPTRTRRLLPGSPAIDTANSSSTGSNACPSTDQRGRPRPRDGDEASGPRCDKGAFELQDPYQADLAVSIADSPDPVAVNQSVTYAVTVTNNGPAQATSVALTNTLPAGVTFGSANASQGACSGTSTVACNLGTLTSGAQATATIVVTTTQAGTVTNTVSVSGSPSDSNLANNTATATTAAQANCQPRPNVRVTTSRGAAGQLNAAIAAQTTAGTGTNALVTVQITRIDNASVRLNGSPATAGPVVTLPAGAQQATLLVERHAPAQNVNAASTVAFTVTDGCGAWPSFVGGGPTAF